MRISYDSEVDALYIGLVEDEHDCRTVRLSDDIKRTIGSIERNPISCGLPVQQHPFIIACDGWDLSRAAR